MAISKSAIKRTRITKKRFIRNRTILSSVRTHIKNARLAIDSKATDADEQVGLAVSALDRAVTKGVLHRNNAARRKSRLIKSLHSSQQSA